MDFVFAIWEFISGVVGGYLVPFVFVLCTIVIIHELGHFLVARWFGVPVRVFSVGFGSEIIGRYDKRGTRWRLSLIPLGGYVAFEEREKGACTTVSLPNDEDPVPRAKGKDLQGDKGSLFAEQPVYVRALVVIAGPVANFLLAIVVFTFLFWQIGQHVFPAVVSAVHPGSPAEEAGFIAGDTIVSVDGMAIKDFRTVQRLVQESSLEPLEVVIDRNGTQAVLHVTPHYQEIEDPESGRKVTMKIIGLKNDASTSILVQRTLPASFAESLKEVWSLSRRLFGAVIGVVSMSQSIDQFGGPIRIAQASGNASSEGVYSLIALIALLSISVGFLNLLPIPLLDGGYLVLHAIEAIRGYPVSQAFQERMVLIGFSLLMLLTFTTFWNDLSHLGVFAMD